MRKVPSGYIVPSAAFTLKKGSIKGYAHVDKTPEAGDVIYGQVLRNGHHSKLENRSGRVHLINKGSRALFVYGNRYAPDHFEGVVPESLESEVDMLAMSGVVGKLKSKNTILAEPTRIKVLGYLCDKAGEVINTKRFPLIQAASSDKRKGKRAKMILVVGSSMNSGKSLAAAMCCWGLSAMGYNVRGSKITGTASLKDILQMNDSGAGIYNDFTHFGHPSTYLLEKEELLHIFNQIDLRYCNNSNNYWVVEIADGILQRETAMLLKSKELTERIHKLVFCAGDALGCIGGLKILAEEYSLTPNAISGKVSSSPLGRKELQSYTQIPVFDNLVRDLDLLAELII